MEMQKKFDLIDVTVKEVLSTIDSKHADVTQAILKANATVCSLKREGVSILNSTKLVSTLMKNFSNVRSISGIEKKRLVMKMMKEVAGNCPEADMILSLTPGLVDNFCTLIKKNKSMLVKLKEALVAMLSTNCLRKNGQL